MANSPFTDEGELKHVVSMIRGWAAGELSSPMTKLKSELRRILLSPSPSEYPLTASEIETASDLRHLLSSGARFSNLQEACIEALSQVLFATEPESWDRERLDGVEILLTRIHGIAGDAARNKLDEGKARKRKVAQGIAKKIAGANDDKVWPLYETLLKSNERHTIASTIAQRLSIPVRTVRASIARLKK